MKKMLAALVAALFATVLASADSFAATADAAKDMAVKAAALIEKEGKQKAYAAFTDRTGEFWKEDGELYVLVINFQGAWEAYPPKPEAVTGASMLDLKDVDGKPIVQDFINIAKEKGEGWSDYKWKNPKSNKIEPKSTYIKRVGDVFVGVGYYKQ